MLYVTTRSNRQIYTPQSTLKTDRAPDGGFYVPFQAPYYDASEIAALRELSFGQCVADVLNHLFSVDITAWDVECTVGRYPVRFTHLGHRISVAECWHNPDWQFSRIVQDLSRLLHKEDQEESFCSDWMEIAARIAVLFAIYGYLLRNGYQTGDTIDVSFASGDFRGPVSAWYARCWGLPIGNIVCSCNCNSNIWDLFSHGQLRTDGVAVNTMTPEGDILVPDGLERLIFGCGGNITDYLNVCRRGGTFYTDENLLNTLRDGMYVSVSSDQRILSAIPNLYSTSGCIMSSYTALAFTGLMDYRSRTGISGNSLIFAEKSPLCDLQTVAHALDITPGDLILRLK